MLSVDNLIQVRLSNQHSASKQCRLRGVQRCGHGRKSVYDNYENALVIDSSISTSFVCLMGLGIVGAFWGWFLHGQSSPATGNRASAEREPGWAVGSALTNRFVKLINTSPLSFRSRMLNFLTPA